MKLRGVLFLSLSLTSMLFNFATANASGILNKKYSLIHEEGRSSCNPEIEIVSIRNDILIKGASVLAEYFGQFDQDLKITNINSGPIKEKNKNSAHGQTDITTTEATLNAKGVLTLNQHTVEKAFLVTLSTSNSELIIYPSDNGIILNINRDFSESLGKSWATKAACKYKAN